VLERAAAGYGSRMSRRRLRLATVVAAAALAGLPACGTDEAVERDTEEVQRDVDRGAGNLDERAKDAGEDAGRDVERDLERGVEDVDGR
jgi:hypothetical protein